MKNLIQLVLNPGSNDKGTALGLLILRLFTGGMMLYAHGWGKLMTFSDKSGKFPDPLGVGSAASLSLVVFAEVFCAAAIILGLFTRLAAIPLLVTMLVAAFVIHGADPFQKKEFALLYAAPFLAFIFTGAGAYSVDSKLAR
jgi:putative oxidoreductase